MPRPPHSILRFTLLELLVVVAVVALLLAILLPALSAANEAGRAAVCGTNVHQLLQGAIAYSQNNDSMMPWYAFASRRPEDQDWWVTQATRGMEAFEPESYVFSSDSLPYEIPVYIFNKIAYMNDGLLRADHAGGHCMWLKVSYRGNCQYTADGGGYNTPLSEARRDTGFARPEKSIMLVEGIQWHQNGKSPLAMRECVGCGNSFPLLPQERKSQFIPSGIVTSVPPTWVSWMGMSKGWIRFRWPSLQCPLNGWC